MVLIFDVAGREPRAQGFGILPTADPTIASCISDEDVALHFVWVTKSRTPYGPEQIVVTALCLVYTEFQIHGYASLLVLKPMLFANYLRQRSERCIRSSQMQPPPSCTPIQLGNNKTALPRLRSWNRRR